MTESLKIPTIYAHYKQPEKVLITAPEIPLTPGEEIVKSILSAIDIGFVGLVKSAIDNEIKLMDTGGKIAGSILKVTLAGPFKAISFVIDYDNALANNGGDAWRALITTTGETLYGASLAFVLGETVTFLATAAVGTLALPAVIGLGVLGTAALVVWGDEVNNIVNEVGNAVGLLYDANFFSDSVPKLDGAVLAIIDVAQAIPVPLSESDNYTVHYGGDFIDTVKNAGFVKPDGSADIDAFIASSPENSYLFDYLFYDDDTFYLSQPSDTIRLTSPDGGYSQSVPLEQLGVPVNSSFPITYDPSDKNIPLNQGIDANGFQFVKYIKQDGTIVTDTAIPNPTESSTTLQRHEAYKSNSAEVTKTYPTDQRGNPIGDPEINVILPKETITYEQIGSVFGSVLAKQLAGDNIFANIALDVVFNTTLQTIGKTLDIYGHGVALTGAGNNPASIQQSFEYSVSKLGDTAYNNIVHEGIGIISSLLTAKLLDGLGLDTIPQAILSTLSNTAFSIVLNNLAYNHAWNLGLIDDFKDANGNIQPGGVTQFGNAVGAYFGSYLASEVYVPETALGQIGSQIGSTIGGIVGTAIPIPIIGSAIGAFLGNLIGGAIGDLFGDHDTPRAGAIVAYDTATQKFSIVQVWSLDKGSSSTASTLATAATDSFNGILQSIHGIVLNPTDLHGGSYGHSQSTLVYWISGGLADGSIAFSSPGDLISYGVIQGLRNAQIAGGDIYEKRAFYATLNQVQFGGSAEINTHLTTSKTVIDPATITATNPHGIETTVYEYKPLSVKDALNTLLGNMAIAAEYKQYLQNAAVINSIIAANPTSAFAIGWIITIAQASQLGLDQRHAEDWIGGWKFFLDDNKLDPTKVNFNLQQYDRIIQGTQTTDNAQITLHDTINPIAKEIFTAGSQNSLIEIQGKTITNLDGFTGKYTVTGDTVAIAPYIIGGAGNDVIIAGNQGADVVGGGGNDIIVGGVLDDWLFGGAGDDVIAAGGGDGNYLFGDAGNDKLIGGEGSDWLKGGDGNDILNGMAGDDIVSGGKDYDKLDGGEGSDLYLYGSGNGIDVIKDSGSASNTDILRLIDINNGAFSIYTSSSSGDLWIVPNTANGDLIVLTKAAFDSSQTIEKLITAEGVTLTLADLLAAAQKSAFLGEGFIGDANNQSLNGTIHDDLLNGGGGTDVLAGGVGSDIYRFTAGSSNHVTVIENGLSQDVDRVELGVGITQADVTLSRGTNNGDMTLNFGSDKGSLSLQNIDADASLTLEEIHLADGSSWTVKDLMNRYIASVTTAGNDQIVGFRTNDKLIGGNGNDTLTGGLGDDVLSGGGGADIYIYNAGDGNDLIEDNGVSNTDKIIFGAGIVASEILISRDTAHTNDVLVSFGNHIGSIKISNLFDGYYGVEKFQFADGTVWTQDDIKAIASSITTMQGDDANNALSGSTGDDALYGGYGNDTLRGGTGNDRMEGYVGNDIYLFNMGDGRDVIHDNHSYGSYDDKLIFGEGILTSNVRVSQDPYHSNNMLLTINENDSILIEDFTNSWGGQLSLFNLPTERYGQA